MYRFLSKLINPYIIQDNKVVYVFSIHFCNLGTYACPIIFLHVQGTKYFNFYALLFTFGKCSLKKTLYSNSIILYSKPMGKEVFGAGYK